MDRAATFLQDISKVMLPAKAQNPGAAGTKKNPVSVTTSKKKVLIVTHGGFIGEFMNVVRSFQGKPAIYSNNAKNTAMFIVQFERNAKGGLKPTVKLENDNSHINLTLPVELSVDCEQSENTLGKETSKDCSKGPAEESKEGERGIDGNEGKDNFADFVKDLDHKIKHLEQPTTKSTH